MTISTMQEVARAEDTDREGPWPLPEGWCWTPIADVLSTLEDGRKLHHGWSPQCEKEAAPNAETWGVLKTTAIQAGQFVPSHNKRLPNHLAPRKSIEVHAGDLLLTCAGPRARCGVACLVRTTRPKLLISGKMYRFRADETLLNSEFLEFFLLTLHAWKQIDVMKTGGSDSGLNLTHDRFLRLLVPLGPLPEQRRIVTRINALFAEIAEGEAALAAARAGLDTFRRALLKAAVTGELTEDWREKNPVTETGHDLLARIHAERAAKGNIKGRGGRASEVAPPDAGALRLLPEGWAWGTLGVVGDIATGGTPPTTDRSNYGGSVPFFKPTDLDVGDNVHTARDYLTEKGAELVGVAPAGAVMVTCIGATIGKSGRLATKGAFNQQINAWMLRDVLSDGRWGYLWITNPIAQAMIKMNASATTLPILNKSRFSSLPIPIPPPAEAAEILRRVSDALAAADDTLATLDAESADAARLRQSILKAAFEGLLVPQDPADEPASVALARVAGAAATRPGRKRGRPRARAQA